MNSFKKITFVLILILAFPLQALAATFDDLYASSQGFFAIQYLVSIGTLQGYDDGTFRPAQTINRAELAKVLVAGQQIDPDAAQYKNCFPDVQDEWFAKYVCYAKAQGWVSGYPDGTFKPSQTVNQVEAPKMIVNAYGLAPAETGTEVFLDVKSSDWFFGYITTLSTIGVVEDNPVHRYYPSDPMTRGLTAEYIFRVLVSNENDEEIYTMEHRDEFLTAAGLGDILRNYTVEDYEVSQVTDGDTIKLANGDVIRLLGVDAPESGDCYGEEAKEHLSALIGSGVVTLESDPKNEDKDQYERLLRYVYSSDGELVNLSMVEDGYAGYYDSFPLEAEMDARFEEAENTAEAASLGVWDACFGGANTSISADTIYIKSVNYDGEVPQVESDEYVEVANKGTATVNLRGYTLSGSSGGEEYTFPNFELAPGASIKIYTNQGDYSFQSNKAIWNNNGETVYLYDTEDKIVDLFEY